jgi:hypothetical protein
MQLIKIGNYFEKINKSSRVSLSMAWVEERES